MVLSKRGGEVWTGAICNLNFSSKIPNQGYSKGFSVNNLCTVISNSVENPSIYKKPFPRNQKSIINSLSSLPTPLKIATIKIIIKIKFRTEIKDRPFFDKHEFIIKKPHKIFNIKCRETQ